MGACGHGGDSCADMWGFAMLVTVGSGPDTIIGTSQRKGFQRTPGGEGQKENAKGRAKGERGGGATGEGGGGGTRSQGDPHGEQFLTPLTSVHFPLPRQGHVSYYHHGQKRHMREGYLLKLVRLNVIFSC